MKKVISIIVAAMMMAMPVFAMADAAATATEAPTADASATEAPAADAAATAPQQIGTTEGGNPIYDLTAPVALDSTNVYQFTDDNFELTLPTDWTELTMTDEMKNVGFYAYYGMADSSMTMAVQYIQGEIGTIDQLITALASIESNTGVTAVVFNGIPFVTYTDTSKDLFGCATVDASQSGYLNFVFTPNSSADMNTIAPQIMSSITTINADTGSAIEVPAADTTATTDAAATEAPTEAPKA